MTSSKQLLWSSTAKVFKSLMLQPQPLGRTPWGGRLVETLGQDPYLNGIAFGIGAKAFADTGIIAGGKHFLLNEQETNRQASGDSSVAPYSSVVDDKALHETYLW